MADGERDRPKLASDEHIASSVERMLGHVAEMTTAGSAAVEDLTDPKVVQDASDINLGSLASAAAKYVATITENTARIVQGAAEAANTELGALKDERRDPKVDPQPEPLPIVAHLAQSHADLAQGILRRSHAGAEDDDATVDDIAIAYWTYWRNLGRSGLAAAKWSQENTRNLSNRRAKDVIEDFYTFWGLGP